MLRREFLRSSFGAAIGAAAFLTGVPAESDSDQGLAASGPSTVLAADSFGAAGDGVADDGPAVLRMLDAAAKCGGSTMVRFAPNKTYRLKTGRERYAFLLDGIRDLTIDGGGSLLLIDSNQRFMKLTNSRNVTVRNLKVDYDPLPFADGLVIAKDGGSGTIDVKIDAAFAMPSLGGPTHEDGEQAYFAMLKFPGPYSSTDEPYLSELHYFLNDVVEAYPGSLNDRVVRLVARDKTAGLFDPIETGKWRVSVPVRGIAHRYGPGHNCALFGNHNVHLEDVDIWSSPWFAFGIINNSGDLSFVRSHVRPKPGTERLTSSWRDGYHVKNNRTAPMWDGCILQGMNDDAFNIATHTSIVRAVKSGSHLVIQQNYPLDIAEIRKGDTIVAYEMHEGRLLGSAKIVQTSQAPVASSAGQPVAPCFDVELDQPIVGLSVDATMVWDADAANAGATIRNCRIDRSCRFHGPMRIEETHFNGLVWIHGDENESPLPSNMQIDNCVFKLGQGNPNLAIVFNGPVVDGHSPAAPIMHDISFTHNRVYGDFSMSDVARATITGNDFADPAHSVTLHDVPGVIFEDNTHGGQPLGLPAGSM